MQILVDKLEAFLPRKKIDIFGKDSLLKTSIPYYMLTAIPAMILFIDSPNPYILLPVAYIGLPLLDQIFSLDNRNPNKEERAQLQKEDAYFRLPLYTTMIMSWAVLFKTLHMFSTLEISFQLILLAFIISNYYTAQFVISHQLIHKPGSYYSLIGILHTIKFFYMHFAHHHLYTHHRQVATPNDPSTAKKGQTIYDFVFKCIVFSWVGVYKDQKQSGKPFFLNYAILSLVSSLIFGFGIYYFYGLQPLVIHLFIVFVAIVYLQSISYIEHYGLERRLLPSGEYEKVNILHSWNAPHRFTNYFFFKVQRHSDHHENSSKPYQTLTSMDESPFLPHGYILMIVMSFFPKVWFKVMDPLVDQYRKLTPESKARIDPQVKENSVRETRKFLIEISVVSLVFLVFSFLTLPY